jgi:hypothetical protein
MQVMLWLVVPQVVVVDTDSSFCLVCCGGWYFFLVVKVQNDNESLNSLELYTTTRAMQRRAWIFSRTWGFPTFFVIMQNKRSDKMEPTKRQGKGMGNDTQRSS